MNIDNEDVLFADYTSEQVADMKSRTYTLADVIEAYECGFYEGAGDDLWYKDHPYDPNTGSILASTASVYRTLKEYLACFSRNLESKDGNGGGSGD